MGRITPNIPAMTDLHRAILHTMLPQQVPGAEVLPPSTWEEFGLSTSRPKPLPDNVAYRSELKTLFIIQAVHRMGAPSAARHSALLRWSAAYQGPRVFVWAYASRTAYAANMGELLADTYLWFADEPKHHAYISGSAEASDRYRKAVRALRA